MIKKQIIAGAFIGALLLGGGLILMKQHKKQVAEQIVSVYPKRSKSYIGDPIPYYNGKEFMLYYLEDHRDGEVGFHPWSLLTTKDFYTYQDYGEVIPYVNDEKSQEQALGTGSVIQDQEQLYHAFYTAHNSNLSPKEAIMHATSKDGKVWQKQPKDTFFGASEYERDDFRDPYVLYDESSQAYWMLITTRKNGKGVIARYLSKDLHHWENAGVFFENDIGNDSNLECPSLVSFGGKWYLAFSDQWDERVVHYRVSSEAAGPFQKPRGVDHFDGAGFYAGQLVTDGEKLYVSGWIPTKEEHDNQKNYNWAGNLAVYELVQSKAGNLKAQLPKVVQEKIIKKQKITPKTIGNVQVMAERYILSEQNSALVFSKEAAQVSVIKGVITPASNNGKWVFQFGATKGDDGTLNLVFDGKKQEVAFFNRRLKITGTREGQTKMPLSIKADKELSFMLVREDDLVVLYLNDEQVLSNRIYGSKNESWEIRTLEGKLEVSDLVQ